MLNKILTTHNQTPQCLQPERAFGGQKIKVMEKVEILTPEIVDQSYANALDLFLGNISFEELADKGEFYLPEDYNDPKVVLQYFEDIEDYETCIKIRDNKL